MSTQDFDAAVNAYREALQSMLKGDSTPVLNLYSRRDDVTLANPLGPPHVGRANLEKASAAVAATFADGVMQFEEVSRFATTDLGYVVAFERAQVRRTGSDETTPMSLRVTTLLRREEGRWLVAHRHADTITTVRPSTTTSET